MQVITGPSLPVCWSGITCRTLAMLNVSHVWLLLASSPIPIRFWVPVLLSVRILTLLFFERFDWFCLIVQGMHFSKERKCIFVRFYISRYRKFLYNLVNKTNRCTEFKFYRYLDSTCFGQPFCPSSGFLSRTSALVYFMQLWWPFATRNRMARGARIWVIFTLIFSWVPKLRYPTFSHLWRMGYESRALPKAIYVFYWYKFQIEINVNILQKCSQ